jgi:hypothetical protein
MPLSFSISSTDLAKLQKYLEKMQSKVNLTDPKVRDSLKEKLEKIMFEDLKKRFASSPSTTVGGIVYGNEEWSSLSDYYLSKRPDRAGGQIYKDTLDLNNSLVAMTSDTISEFKQKGSQEVTYIFGTKIKYAEKLQEMRPIVFLHEELIEELVEAYKEFIIEKDED